MTLYRILHFVRLGAAPRRVVMPLLDQRRQVVARPRVKVSVPRPRGRPPAEGPRREFFESFCLV